MPAKNSSNSSKKGGAPRKVRAVPAAWVTPFLDAITRGVSVGSAANLVGIHRSTHAHRLDSDASYAERYTDAVETFLDSLEDRVVMKAVKPDADARLLLRILEVRRPDKWAAKATKVDVNANINATINAPADEAAYAWVNQMAALKATIGVMTAKAKDAGFGHVFDEPEAMDQVAA